MADNTQGFRIASQETEEKFREKMAEIQLKEKEHLTQERGSRLGLSYINLSGFPIGPETLSLIPRAIAEKLKTVCFLKSGHEIRVAAVDPERAGVSELVDELAAEHNAHIGLYVISQHSFEQALKLYDRIPHPRKVISGIEIKGADIAKYRSELTDFHALERQIHHVPLTEVFTLILAGAIEARASDIHIEAEEEDVKVRYRIDGVLQTAASLPKDTWPRIINRIKLLAGLKINIENIPQDGRVTLYLDENRIDVRVSTLPTAFGESAVLRLLNSNEVMITFEELGLRNRAFNILEEQSHRPNGMILTSGPTGSGKTTTLYAITIKLNAPDTKIITLEDPIEYRLQGINQSQVDWSKGYTFAKGLRAMLRQDPDVVLVGEVRDLETAETAIQAALTGHLVLSTLHTNDAVGVVPRLLSMGVKPYLLAPALNVIMAQRLVRKICDQCQVEDQIDETTLERVRGLLTSIPLNSGEVFDTSRPLTFKRGAGCNNCRNLGFRGRIGIFELFTMSPEIEKLILTGSAPEAELKELARQQGMITMAQDGLLKALDGLTTVSEVFSVAE
ncbi:MAG: type II/IV secretion system protein [Candidatus Kerfeldbacteria bacterium]|nr:type II/IV secretion system protein [Candidatus Kerfeldbacteria bacterium]